MKVAYLLHQAGIGGERLLTRFLSSVDRRRVEPLVILPCDGPIRHEIEALGVRTVQMPLSWWIPSTHWSAPEFLAQLEGVELRAATLASLLEREKIDLVHTFFLVTIEGALAAAEIAKPHVWHSRGYFGNGFPPAYFDDVPFLFSVVDELSDTLVSMSQGIDAQATQFCRATQRAVIYDGYDFDAFLNRPRPEAAAVRAQYGVADTARVIANVGGIQRRKGQLDLVEAARAIASRFPDVVFTVAGSGNDLEFRERLDARIRELELERHFRFIGFEPDIFNLLSISEALVHPSHSEGFGLAILEAMAMSLPVVATRCGGPEEMIEDGDTGRLVDVADPPALAAAVNAVLADPVDARAMGVRAGRAARAFSLKTTAERTATLYEGLASPAHAGRIQPDGRLAAAEAIARELLRRARAAAAIGTTA